MDLAHLAKNVKKLPVALPGMVKNIQKLMKYNQVVSDRREKHAPLAYTTFEQFKMNTTWSPVAHAWVDPELPLNRKVCLFPLFAPFPTAIQ